MKNASTCTVCDDKLLLLAHHELGAVETWLLNRHVKNCPRCQLLVSDLSIASSVIATVVRDTAAPAWHRPTLPGFRTLGLSSALTAIAATAVIAGSVGAVFMEYHYYNPDYQSVSAAAYIEGTPHVCTGLVVPSGFHHHHHHHVTPPM